MASVPCYVLAGFLRNRRKSSEAALKYAVYGAGAAGIMLFGMSLLAGVLGSAHLPTMAQRLAELLESGAGGERTLVLLLGGLMLMVGVAFKLAAVPFHFWAPDVFEGASAEVAAFLSVASKAAALALLVRLAAVFSFNPDPVLLQNLAPVRQFIGLMIAVLAAVTCTFGNLAAYGQTNMKRLLAYSTIAHAGYMMMPVAAAVVMIGNNIEGARDAVSAMAVYIGIYLFMNLAAFAGVAFSAQFHSLRRTCRLFRAGAPLAGLCRLHGHRDAQPPGHSAFKRIRGQGDGFFLLDSRQNAGAFGHRRAQYRAQSVLLPSRHKGHDTGD